MEIFIEKFLEKSCTIIEYSVRSPKYDKNMKENVFVEYRQDVPSSAVLRRNRLGLMRIIQNIRFSKG